jgi:hypothetical protein
MVFTKFMFFKFIFEGLQPGSSPLLDVPLIYSVKESN